MIVDKININDNCVLGKKVKIINPVNLYGCKIGNNSFVGPFVEVQNDVVIFLRTLLNNPH